MQHLENSARTHESWHTEWGEERAEKLGRDMKKVRKVCNTGRVGLMICPSWNPFKRKEIYLRCHDMT